MSNNNAIVTLNGNLGRDPEIRSGDRGEYAYISIATQDSFLDTNGRYHSLQTVWHDVAVNNEAILNRLKLLKKGSKVSVEATLDYRRKKVFDAGQERTLKEPRLDAVSLEPVVPANTEESV